MLDRTALLLGATGLVGRHCLERLLTHDAYARIVFYNRVKGEVEDAIAQLDYDGFYVMRPSLLTGDRDETRWGERIAEGVLNLFSFALHGPLRRARPTPAADVAAAMVAVAVQQPGGRQVYEPDAIRQWAEHPAAGTTTDPQGA